MSAFTTDTPSYGGDVQVWELETGRELTTLRGHTLGICALQFDEQKLATSSEDATVRLWDVRTERTLRILYGHRGWVKCLRYNDEFLWSG